MKKKWEVEFDERFSVFDGSQKIIKHVTYSSWVKDFILSALEEQRKEGYKNVRSWFKSFNYPALDKDSKRCGVCGGKVYLIRGRYPHTPKRKACPVCAVEIIESIVDNLISNIDGPTQEVSHKKETK